MELKDYIGALRRHGRLIAVVLFASIAAATFLAVRAVPVYRSCARLFVAGGTDASTFSDPYSLTLVSQSRVETYAQLAGGGQISDTVSKALDLKDPAGNRRWPQLSVSVPTGTTLMDMCATDLVPAIAQASADAAAQAFVQLAPELEGVSAGKPSPIKVTVVEKAPTPAAPIAPRRKLTVISGALLGLVVGGALALIREKLDTTLRTPEEITAVTGVPVIGLIAGDQAFKRRPLVVHSAPRSPAAESFRQVRTNLRFVGIGGHLSTLVVTSAVAGEGKSTISCNLAIAFAQAGAEVILVEADLRKPAVCEFMGIEGSVGLSNVLLGDVHLSDALQPWGGGLLRILPAGSVPPNPSELLGSAAMKAIIRDLALSADIVIFDSPPLLPVTDAAVLGRSTDGVVLVVAATATGARVKDAVESLRAVGASLVGVVTNMSTVRDAGSSYYQYGGQERRRTGWRRLVPRGHPRRAVPRQRSTDPRRKDVAARRAADAARGTERTSERSVR